MSSLKVFGHPVSQPSRSVLIFVAAADIEHEYKFVDIMKGEQKSEEFKKVNPNQKIPAILDGDFNLSEGAAILVYLATSREKTDPWYPSDPKTQGKIHAWMHWSHTTIRKGSTMQLLVPILLAGMKMEQCGEGTQTVSQQLPVLEEALGNSKYLAGDQPTIADIFVVPEVDQLIAFGLHDMAEFKNINRWLADLKENVKGYKENFLAVEAAAKK